MSEFKAKLVEKMDAKGSYVSIHYEAIVQCKICKRMETIRINKIYKDKYTEEVLNNWICILCKTLKKKENKNGTTGVSSKVSTEPK